jgi:hypothetical protein
MARTNPDLGSAGLLREPDYGLLGGIGQLRVGPEPAVEGVVTHPSEGFVAASLASKGVVAPSPLRVSLPPPAQMTSFAGVPEMVSALAVPRMVNSGMEPRRRGQRRCAGSTCSRCPKPAPPPNSFFRGAEEEGMKTFTS